MKKVLALVLVLCIAFSLCAVAASADDVIKLKLHYVDPETAPYVQGGLKIAELVSEATDGRIQIEVLSGGSLGGERDTIELAMDNSLDIATWASLTRLTSGKMPMRLTLPLTVASANSSKRKPKPSVCMSSVLRNPVSGTPSPPSPSPAWRTSKV